MDQKALVYIDFALDKGRRTQKMIADLLELSRSGSDRAEKELISSGLLIEDIKKNIIKLIEEHNAEIIIKTDMPEIVYNRADISRVFQNILSNAVKFRKKLINPVISLCVKELADERLFSIQDNGFGIEPDKLNKVFDIFTRLHSDDTFKGSGIGLAICKRIVEHYGGSIWIKSKEGIGSVFYFTIKKETLT